jgi:hypothetical protein
MNNMDKSELNRREFQRLTGAALGGMLLGAGALKSSLLAAPAADSNPLLGDNHVCRGLNTCKAKGADKKNSCAGTGSCAVAKKHTCHASNDCKGQGGCGAHPGENTCKGMGECAVPLKPATWTKARKRYEELMKAAGEKFGPAPKKG